MKTTKIKLADKFEMVCEHITKLAFAANDLDGFEEPDGMAAIDTCQKVHWLTVECCFSSDSTEYDDGYRIYHSNETLLEIIVSDRVDDAPVMLTIIDIDDTDNTTLTEYYREFAKEIIDELREFSLVADDKKRVELEPVPNLYLAVLESINTLHSKHLPLTLTSIAIDLMARGFRSKATGNEYSASHISEIITKLEKAGYDVSKYRDNSNKRISS